MSRRTYHQTERHAATDHQWHNMTGSMHAAEHWSRSESPQGLKQHMARMTHDLEHQGLLPRVHVHEDRGNPCANPNMLSGKRTFDGAVGADPQTKLKNTKI